MREQLTDSRDSVMTTYAIDGTAAHLKRTSIWSPNGTTLSRSTRLAASLPACAQVCSRANGSSWRRPSARARPAAHRRTAAATPGFGMAMFDEDDPPAGFHNAMAFGQHLLRIGH